MYEEKLEIKIREMYADGRFSIGVYKVVYKDGVEYARSQPEGLVLGVGQDLNSPIQTGLGELTFAQYPNEKVFIEGKWKELSPA